MPLEPPPHTHARQEYLRKRARLFVAVAIAISIGLREQSILACIFMSVTAISTPTL